MNKQCLSAVVLTLAAASVRAEDLQYELLLFPSVDVVRTSGAADVLKPDANEETISGDFLFSVQHGQFRLLGEYLLSNHESELERFQFGWEPTADTMVWLGRFHQPSSVWNHEHHHGQFLQTSISRPVIEEWEDEEGVIPQHFVGLLAESSWHLGSGRGLRTALGVGIAPVLTDEGLEPVDLIHASADDHQMGVQARIAFVPDELGDSTVGLLLAHNELNWLGEPPPQFAMVSHVDQTVIGLFGNYTRESWRLFGAAYHVKAEMKGADAPGSDDDFLAGYLQYEINLPHGLEPFARYEGSVGAEDALYLQIFPNFATSELSVGLRWQFARRQALSLQLSDVHTLLDDYEAIGLQWSAALF